VAAASPVKLLVAPDSFKGTLAAADVAAAIASGLRSAGAEADVCPLGDGGEGTAAALVVAQGGTMRRAAAHDPLGRATDAEFAILADGVTAVVDAAAASGMALLGPGELDAERASSIGTGELIAAAIDAGAETVLVAGGGSAMTDGGLGAVEALRKRGGIGKARLEVLCDVRTPFERAAEVFAPQKGADAQAVRRLGSRLERLAAEYPRDPRGRPMTGCAGGLAGGLWACFDARLRPGASYIAEMLGVPARLERADAAVSGEGRVDEQSFEGKVVGTLAELCSRSGTPLHVIAGGSSLDEGQLRERGIASFAAAGDRDALAAAARALVSSRD
jgi:glycerate kinase